MWPHSPLSQPKQPDWVLMWVGMRPNQRLSLGTRSVMRDRRTEAPMERGHIFWAASWGHFLKGLDGIHG